MSLTESWDQQVPSVHARAEDRTQFTGIETANDDELVLVLH